MVDDKSAFVFDTNFIIENINLKEVVENLSERFVVYVSQVSIDERISQKYLELKKKYDKIAQLENDYRGIAKISITKSLEKRAEAEKQLTQKGYDDLFGAHIIPFERSEDTFSEILDRVYKKLPPFLSVDGSSDKGFKDSLIWLSMLRYFKSNGEESVVFVTNDNGFRKNADALCSEFVSATEKKIEIKDNSYYKSLIEIPQAVSSVPVQDIIPDMSQLRDQIRDVIQSLCRVDSIDSWGNPDWDRTFTLNQKVDSDYMKVIFEGLKRDISNHIFEESVPADNIIALDERVTNVVPIPMFALENASHLYDDVKKKFPDYIPQFYSAATNIINQNYVVTNIESADDDLPF